MQAERQLRAGRCSRDKLDELKYARNAQDAEDLDNPDGPRVAGYPYARVARASVPADGFSCLAVLQQQ